MPVRLGFLGAGLAARIHHQWLSSVGEEVQWAAVHDPDLRRARDFSALTGARLCHEEQEVFELSDAVYVCTWTSEHPRLVAAAAGHRLPVYCEKPLAVSVELARRMARHVREAGIVNQAGLVLRHSPAFHWVRHLLGDPASGQLMSISFRDDQYLPVDGYYASRWRSDPSLAGSGVLLEHSIHDIDILEFLAGPIRRLSCSTRSVHEISGIEDVAHVSLSSRQGYLAA